MVGDGRGVFGGPAEDDPVRRVGVALNLQHLDAEQRVGDGLIGLHGVGAGVAWVGDGLRIDRRDGQATGALARQLRRLRHPVGAKKLARPRPFQLRHGALAQCGFGAVKTGVGDQRIFKIADRALPDIGVKHCLAAGPVRRAGEIDLRLVEVQLIADFLRR